MSAKICALLSVLALCGCSLFPGQPPRILNAQPLIISDKANSDGWAIPRWPTTLVAIEFTTDRDLWDYAHRHEYNLGAEASLCGSGAIDHQRELQYDPYVFSRTGPINPFETEAPAGTFYRVYFSLKRFPTASDKPETFFYDLRAKPQDICFQLGGSAMWFGEMFDSNVVTVPKASLVAAMSKPGPQ